MWGYGEFQGESASRECRRERGTGEAGISLDFDSLLAGQQTRNTTAMWPRG